MSSQYEKRKAKAEQVLKAKREKIRDTVEIEAPIQAKTTEVSPDYTHEGYDICLAEDGRKYEAVVFKYNPRTKAVKVETIVPVQRQVALIFDQQRHALKTLIKRK